MKLASHCRQGTIVSLVGCLAALFNGACSVNIKSIEERKPRIAVPASKPISMNWLRVAAATDEDQKLPEIEVNPPLLEQSLLLSGHAVPQSGDALWVRVRSETPAASEADRSWKKILDLPIPDPPRGVTSYWRKIAPDALAYKIGEISNSTHFLEFKLMRMQRPVREILFPSRASFFVDFRNFEASGSTRNSFHKTQVLNLTDRSVVKEVFGNCAVLPGGAGSDLQRPITALLTLGGIPVGKTLIPGSGGEASIELNTRDLPADFNLQLEWHCLNASGRTNANAKITLAEKIDFIPPFVSLPESVKILDSNLQPSLNSPQAPTRWTWAKVTGSCHGGEVLKLKADSLLHGASLCLHPGPNPELSPFCNMQEMDLPCQSSGTNTHTRFEFYVSASPGASGFMKCGVLPVLPDLLGLSDASVLEMVSAYPTGSGSFVPVADDYGLSEEALTLKNTDAGHAGPRYGVTVSLTDGAGNKGQARVMILSDEKLSCTEQATQAK